MLIHVKVRTLLNRLRSTIGFGVFERLSHKTKATKVTAPLIVRPKIRAESQGCGFPPHEMPSKKSVRPATRRNMPGWSTRLNSCHLDLLAPCNCVKVAGW